MQLAADDAAEEGRPKPTVRLGGWSARHSLICAISPRHPSGRSIMRPASHLPQDRGISREQRVRQLGIVSRRRAATACSPVFRLTAARPAGEDQWSHLALTKPQVRCRRVRAYPSLRRDALFSLGPGAPVPGKLGAMGASRRCGSRTVGGGGRYHGQLDHSWDLVAVPRRDSGIAWRCGRRLGSRRPRTAPAYLVRPCSPVKSAAGPLDIHVSVRRRGRSATQSRPRSATRGLRRVPVSLRCSDFVAPGRSFVDAVPPRSAATTGVPLLQRTTATWIQPFEPLPFWSRVRGARCSWPPAMGSQTRGHRIRRGHMAAVRQPSQLADGAIDPLACSHPGRPECPDASRASGSPRSAVVSRRAAGSDRVPLFEPLRTEWLLAHDRARWADDGWAAAESVLWDRTGLFVAYATR